MAPWIIERLAPHEHFVETCAGSAAITAAKPPSMFETVNDVFGEVVNFFQVLRNPLSAANLIDMVSFTPYAHSEFDAAFEPCHDSLTRAFRFFVRMQMAVIPGKSGWSYSVGGQSAKKANKPGRWATMPAHIKRTAERFERVQVTSWSAVDCISRLDAPGVLHVVDPPYIEETRPNSTDSKSAYAHDNFSHEAFVEACQSTTHADIYVTHYPHPFYNEGPWQCVGDYTSHKNIPNTANLNDRSEAVERLYRFRR